MSIGRNGTLGIAALLLMTTAVAPICAQDAAGEEDAPSRPQQAPPAAGTPLDALFGTPAAMPAEAPSPPSAPSPSSRNTQFPAAGTGDILVQEGILFNDWQRRRVDVDTSVGQLRGALRSNSMADILGAAREFEDAITEFAEYARVIMAEEAGEIDALLNRLERLMGNYIADWETGNQLQLVNTLRLIEQTTGRLEEMAQLSDLRNDRVRGQFLAGLPLDWGQPRYGDESTRLGLSLLSADEILARMENRHLALRRSAQQRRLQTGDLAMIYEIGELGRALVLRQNEFPKLMRPGLRNAALRIDVISENLVDFMMANDRPAYRRQLMELERAMDRLREFYALRDRSIRERIRANE